MRNGAVGIGERRRAAVHRPVPERAWPALDQVAPEVERLNGCRVFHSGRLRRYGEIQIGPGDENRPTYNNQHFKRISATNRQHAPDVRY
jgi:hypothetical protein